ncbi:PadR family transcriptional regulator [Actinomycetospora endophytica]|uniref:PadR family transcriptional regulator n=1 Tax=Actinomycetospora endophytica TaxID=2291215 RepID=A0ABS8PIT7_9PSEU|nr:PadR family transcriptional regulator [Actinomycetospora endophytica]MCD2198180.1 PadR family transcriptional regulator [Actinomycetospora endophytica]
MSEQTFLVLTALADEPMHGYGIVRAAEELSEGQVRLRVGTLYGALDRLVADGLIEPDREEIHQGRLRRYYRITDAGLSELVTEGSRREASARVALDRVRARRPRPETGGSTA